MEKDKIVEIKRGQEGTGLLIENDGYISVDCGDNKKLFKEINSHKSNEFHCPNPFVVSAVFQKYGIENANGRIYPEHILKREVARYQAKIDERRAIGECYRPEAMILTKKGWKRLDEISDNEMVVTLNPGTNEIELHQIDRIVKYHFKGNLLHIQGEEISDVVTPDHEYPIFDKDKHFVRFVSAKDIADNSDFDGCFIPKGNLNKEKENLIEAIDRMIPLSKGKITVTEVPYDDDVMCVEVPNHIWYVMDNGKCHWTKNCNHPSDSVIDLSRVAINIIELHWEGHTLVGKMEILVSEGFRRSGIISCQGDQVAHLLLNGIKIGVSSRGLGTVTKRMGVLYVADDYEIVCWDVVSDPSTPNAWIAPEDKIPQQYLESKENKGKNTLLEKLDTFSSWLND